MEQHLELACEAASLAAGTCAKILDGEKFFKIKKTDGKNAEAECLKCGKMVKGTMKQSTNYLLHLKEKDHETLLNEYLKIPKKKTANRQATLVPPDASQSKLNFQKINRPACTKSTSSKADSLITDYIVDAILPLTTVRKPSFKRLVNGLQGKLPDAPILTYEKLVGCLDQRVAQFVNNMKNVVYNTKFICITCDAWSGGGRNFLGATMNFIVPEQRSVGLKREAYVIALQRFDGAHTYDRIRDLLLNLLDKYEIPLDKVVGVVTDGGSNFVKAFKVYGSSFADYCTEVTSHEDEDPELNVVDIDDSIIDALETDAKQRKLPPHFKCVAITLHRIASADVAKLLSSNKNSAIQALNKALSACSELWKLCAFPKQREKILQICGKVYKKPVDTRWNSWYRAIERVVQLFDKLDSVYKAFPDLNRLSDYHKSLLKEYLVLMEPVANAIDDLQGENVFLGDFLPSLLLVQQILKDNRPTHLSALKEQILDSLESRYGNVLCLEESSENYMVAAVSHPAHKLHWIHDAEKRKLCQDLLFKYMQKNASGAFKASHVEPQPVTSASSMLQHRRLQFSYSKTSSTTSTDSELSIELHGYLNDESGEITALEKFPTVKEVFLRFNTLMPSQAGSECLFSYGKLIINPRRQTLSDKQIESLALLKCCGQNIED